jgi:hypothetical protein
VAVAAGLWSTLVEGPELADRGAARRGIRRHVTRQCRTGTSPASLGARDGRQPSAS